MELGNLDMNRLKKDENSLPDEMLDAVYPELCGLAIIKLSFSLFCALVERMKKMKLRVMLRS